MNLKTRPEFQLDHWRARQAAMLYHFSSREYLEGLCALVTRAIEGVIDPALDLARAQGRDAVLTDARWGTRNTSENWANSAFPMLRELQASLAKDCKLRAFEEFDVTYVCSTLRGIDEFSMAWATESEGQKYDAITGAITEYASRIDRTLAREPTAGWTDFTFAAEFPDFLAMRNKIPFFKVDTSVVMESGSMPYRTGAYVSADDPNAALQFAWAGPHPCPLRPACTFNEVGLEALSFVGRNKLWFDEEAMLKFATTVSYREMFADFMTVDQRLMAILAPPAVALEAFTYRPSKWYFVEIIAEDGEDSKLTYNE